MCRQGTWCDVAIIQGVADAYNFVESVLGFCERTVVEPHHSYQPCRSIFLGHVGESLCIYCSDVKLCCK